uniref:Uncharacterized protein n=1 Tax=Zea mays TaxID=4577 RepID=A0A804Q203_MAIZE
MSSSRFMPHPVACSLRRRLTSPAASSSNATLTNPFLRILSASLAPDSERSAPSASSAPTTPSIFLPTAASCSARRGLSLGADVSRASNRIQWKSKQPAIRVARLGESRSASSSVTVTRHGFSARTAPRNASLEPGATWRIQLWQLTTSASPSRSPSACRSDSTDARSWHSAAACFSGGGDVTPSTTLKCSCTPLDLAKLARRRPISASDTPSCGGTAGRAEGTVMRSSGGPPGRFESMSMSVGHCMQRVTLRSTTCTAALPTTARRMAPLEAVKPKRCHGMRSTYSASSVTDMARSRGAGVLAAAAAAADWVVLPGGAHRRHARATSARSNHDVRRWLGSPCEEAMLLSTHMACCASVTSLDSSAAAQWRRSCWMRGPSMSAPERQAELCALRLPPPRPPVLSSCSMLRRSPPRTYGRDVPTWYRILRRQARQLGLARTETLVGLGLGSFGSSYFRR